jgi:hypothetical protein
LSGQDLYEDGLGIRDPYIHKMVYQRGVHQIGVRNEKKLVELLSNGLFKNIFAPGTTFVQRGGTQTTSDIDAIRGDRVEGISVKNWSGGTHDWVNTSKFMLSKEINKIFQISIRKKCEKYIPEDFKRNEKNIRSSIENIIDKVLDLPQVWEREVERILHTLYDKYPEHVIVTDTKNDKIIYYPKCEENFQEFVKCSSPEWDVVLKKGRGASSRQIWRKCVQTGQEINTNLRIRIVLNNGVGALCGFSNSNSNSRVCLKIQQEKIENHLNSLSGASSENIDQ